MSTPLAEFIDRAQRLFVLTGAGCSTDSGIPDYRDADGQWKRTPPVTYQAFMGELATRQRSWARSLLGWPRFGWAQPNRTHAALAALEARGQVELLLTQNVDRLHQRAGSEAVIDLHGRLDQVRCMGCEARTPREAFQQRLLALNPGERVATVHDHLQRADAVLVVGSSLMVYSGFRFVQAAAQAGLPIAALNRGLTRADALLSLKVDQSCADALAFLLPGTPTA